MDWARSTRCSPAQSGVGRGLIASCGGLEGLGTWKSFDRREKSPRCARRDCWSGRRTATGAAAVRPGVVTAEIDAAIERFFLEHRAEPLFKGVPGTVPFPATTCISINEEVVHGIPGPRKLKEGDIVSIDTGCRLNGWCGDAAATYADWSDLARSCGGCWTSPAKSWTWRSD